MKVFSLFFQFFVDSHWHHPQEELAKFGYKLERKVINFKNSANLWWPARTFCLKYVNFRIKFPRNLATLEQFFHKNPLYELHWIFLCCQMTKFSPPKRNGALDELVWLLEPSTSLKDLEEVTSVKWMAQSNLEDVNYEPLYMPVMHILVSVMQHTAISKFWICSSDSVCSDKFAKIL
jgi:hypothetical protein